MNTITKHVVLLVLCLIASTITAQEQQKDSIAKETIPYVENGLKIDRLEETKKTIANEERDFLKQEVETINQRLDKGDITSEEAENLKKEAALKHAANIEDRIAIIDAKINLLKRNPGIKHIADEENNAMSINIGSSGFLIDFAKGKRKPPKYDIRTSNKLLFSIGFNNAIGDGQDLSNTPYELGGSGFVELGWIWETRLSKTSNFARINYGFAFQWNKLNVKDDLYFVQNGDQTTLEEFPVELRKSQLRVTNLVFPVHIEFGPSKFKDYGNRIRYSTYNKFKVGLGGYAGVRLATQSKLRYKEDGDKVKDKSRRSFNASTFVYGLSAYVGYGQISLYAKYDLNPLFKDQLVEQHNVSLGLRFDLH
ncbi:hypothetical protein [Psychroserpens ponticola]|uniref:PorT family protein n=1 Tax=Psychroserpens ponticola TaxID=2932268 RepID=A0ABY7RYE8_9FLAO|nr:hypothetical protein [Psychroserpens ponticola]WCO02171.1 hypothetical protein MUN68_001475 [Psychroserpens ponticola]